MWTAYSHKNRVITIAWDWTERQSLNWLRDTQGSDDDFFPLATCQKCNEAALSWLCIFVFVLPTRVYASHLVLMGLRRTLDGACTTLAVKSTSVSRCVSNSMLHLFPEYFLWCALCSIKWSHVIKYRRFTNNVKYVIFYFTDQCNKEIKGFICISVYMFTYAYVYTQSWQLQVSKDRELVSWNLFYIALKSCTCTELRWKDFLLYVCTASSTMQVLTNV